MFGMDLKYLMNQFHPQSMLVFTDLFGSLPFLGLHSTPPSILQVNMCICVYVYMCIYVYMYICICIYMYVYICICVYVYICMYIYVYMYIYECLITMLFELFRVEVCLNS